MIEISLIMAAYNASDYIRESLDSALAQTHAPAEIIIVDDGSSDETASIVEEYMQRYPQILLIRQENQGTGYAKNRAIETATKPWIAMLDADDTWHPDKLRQQALVANQAGPELGLVYCWSVIITSNGKAFRLSGTPRFSGQVWGPLLTECFVGNGSVPLIRKEAFEKAGGYTTAQDGTVQGTEDWALYIRIAENYHFATTESYLVNYRIHDANISSSFLMMETYFQDMLKQHNKNYPALPRCIYRLASSSFYSYMMSRTHSENKFGPALRFSAKVLQNNPAQILNSNFWRMNIMLWIRMALCLLMGKRNLARLFGKIRKNRIIHTENLHLPQPSPLDAIQKKKLYNRIYWKRINDLKQLQPADYIAP